jgi:hypothetical protein
MDADEARAEDVRWMVATGENLSGAARRLGLSPKGLEKWCQRRGLGELAYALRRREPIDHNANANRCEARVRWAS